MTLAGLHILLTYRCLSECDHCFVWGSPAQRGVFSLANLSNTLDQARELGTIQWIYFEGGEPFFYHPILVQGVQAAAARGFHVGLVTNGYWATTAEDARLWLEPLAGSLQSLSVSADELHYDVRLSPEAQHVLQACQSLGISADMLVCDLPQCVRADSEQARSIMYRGRCATPTTGRCGVTWKARANRASG